MDQETCFSCSKKVPKKEICYVSKKYPEYKFCKKCWEELEGERNFKFDKENVPEKLKKTIEDIENNIRKWKSFYMATWGLVFHFIDKQFITEESKEKEIPWGLPAANRKAVLYSPTELKKYLTGHDAEIHLHQLIGIFILLEKYFSKYYELIENTKKLSFFDASRFWQLKKYLAKKKFASDPELLLLELAKETRNCFMHKGIINAKWLRIYQKTNRKNNYKIGENVPLAFSSLEVWSKLLIKIVEKSIKNLKVEELIEK